MTSRTAFPFACAAGLIVATMTAVAQSPPPLLPQDNRYPNRPVVPDGQVPFSGLPSLGVGDGGNDGFLSEGRPVRLPDVKREQIIRFSPRYGTLGELDWQRVDPETQRLVYTGGLIVNVLYPVPGPGKTTLFTQYEFAADNLVAWLKNTPAFGMNQSVEVGGPKRTQLELYLTGNVVVRSREKVVQGGQARDIDRTLRADAIYYDVENNRAIAQQADLEMGVTGVKDSVHVYAEEMQRRGLREWTATRGGVFSSKLPSDPGIRLLARDLTYTETLDPQRNFLGIRYSDPFRDGEPSFERTLTAVHARTTLAGVPVFYTPYMKSDLAEPLGPLQGVGFGQDQLFGTQFFTTWDIYKLLALRSPTGHNWRLMADYMSERGPAFGTEYDLTEKSLLGFGGRAGLAAKFYGLTDAGEDQLGPRGPEPKNPEYRFRSRVQYVQDLYAEREENTFLRTGLDVTLQSQFAYQSDKNFLEQFFYKEYAYGPNQETFAYLKATDGPLFGSVLVQDGQNRTWMTETNWLPRADVALIGRSFFDTIVYSARASAGYAEFRPAIVLPPPVLATDQQRLDTGRFDLSQEVSVPFDLGPVRLAPYGVLDLTAYSQVLTGESASRVIGGGGVRSSLTLSRVYREAASELFNVHGLNHKVTLTGNYYAAESDTPYTRLPQLDRLNDDPTDIAYRNIHPYWRDHVPAQTAKDLQTHPAFDPQQYAIRRLVENKVDTRDSIQVVRLGVDQRLQTKRGYAGNEHTVDFVTLNLSASVFPDAQRDNFGQSVAFLEYFYLWNVGDRVAVQSAGWFDPYQPGTKYYNVGVYLNRPDGTNFFFGYRQLDPVNSKAVMGGVYYALSAKYALSVDTSYDFGTQQALSNTFTLNRVGKDLTIGIGFTYNAIVNNFGFQFSILPNLASGTRFGRAGSPQISGGRQ